MLAMIVYPECSIEARTGDLNSAADSEARALGYHVECGIILIPGGAQIPDRCGTLRFRAAGNEEHGDT